MAGVAQKEHQARGRPTLGIGIGRRSRRGRVAVEAQVAEEGVPRGEREMAVRAGEGCHVAGPPRVRSECTASV